MPIRGQVKWFDPKKGFGFIHGPEDQDVFVHYTQIEGEGFRSLKDDETVEYELIQGDKGWQARAVHHLGESQSEGGEQNFGDRADEASADDDARDTAP